MSLRGRPPKPSGLKLIAGTERKSRINREEPRPEITAPDPPFPLHENAAAEWARIVQELEAVGVMSNLDQQALAAYCVAFGRWRDAEDALAMFRAQDPKAKGLVIKTIQGNLIQNPLVGVANNAMDKMLKIGAEFGLTPATRSRVKSEGGAPTKDPARRFFDD